MNEIARLPQVLACNFSGVERPARPRVSAQVRGRARQPAQACIDREAASDPLEQVVRVDAVVVRERDQLGAHVLECGVTGARQAARRA